jgi:hypothetical protein
MYSFIIWLEFRKVKAAISLMMTQAFCSIRISYLFYASVPLLKIVSPMREAGEGVQSVINEICS